MTDEQCGLQPSGPPDGVDCNAAPLPNPRTLPPRHAETVAADVFARVAGGTRLRRRTVRRRWRRIAVGSLLLAAAAVIYWQQIDAGLLFLGSLSLAVVGGVVLLKGLLRP